MFDFSKTISKLAIVCVPGLKLLNEDWKKYWNKHLFDSEFINNLPKFKSLAKTAIKAGGIKFKHFYETNWLEK